MILAGLVFYVKAYYQVVMGSVDVENIQQWIDDDGYLVNPTLPILRELAQTLVPGEGSVNVLVTKDVFRAIDREYTQASQLAWLVEKDVISFRGLKDNYQSNIVVTDSVVGVFLSLQNFTVAVGVDKQDLVTETQPIVNSLWESGQQLQLRTPSRVDVEETFNQYLGADVHDTFVTSIRAMEDTVRSDLQRDLDGFSHSKYTYASLIIAAAVHEITLRELSRSVERCFLTSRSTLSRVKKEIENEGFISTTPGESSVGRPPMRLHIAGLYTGDNVELLANRVYEDLEKGE